MALEISFSKSGFLGRIAANRKMVLVILLIFLLAFTVRGYNLKYDLFFGFDSYYHARMTSYILEDGFLPDKDPMAYYQIGYSSIPPIGAFFWYFSAAIYKIFTLGAPYDKGLWIEFVKILPALYGALTSVAMYLDRKSVV